MQVLRCSGGGHGDMKDRVYLQQLNGMDIKGPSLVAQGDAEDLTASCMCITLLPNGPSYDFNLSCTNPLLGLGVCGRHQLSHR